MAGPFSQPGERSAQVESDACSVDFLMLADRAEVLNNKLYMMGGAWDHVSVVEGRPVGCSFALAFLVPWTATDMLHRFRIEIADGDLALTLYTLEGAFNAGRPPQLQPGHAQRLIVAPESITIEFPKAGDYVIRVLLDGQVKKTAGFRVDFRPAP